MKNVSLLILLFFGCFTSWGAELTASSQFNSVQDFISAVAAFKSQSANSYLSVLVTVPEEGQPEDPATGKPITARSIKSCDLLWQDQSEALVFATAIPPLQATNCSVGVLFFLKQVGGHWKIADRQRFVATGKYAQVTAVLSANAGSGYKLDDDMLPVVTITENQGGRGYSYDVSGSFTLSKSLLVVVPP